MRKQRLITVVAAALVVGVVAGNVVSGWAAAPAPPAITSTTAPAGLGLRLGAAMQAGGARLVDVVAKLTGMDVEEVTAKRAEGASFATIAAAEGVSSAKVVDSALAARKAILDEKVTAGTITAAQAATALTNMETRLTDRVTSTDASCDGSGGGAGKGGGMMGGRGGGRGAGMGRGAGCATPATTATQ